jgi:protein-S-isoprenylcysteine O-methyltransferase Ste14
MLLIHEEPALSERFGPAYDSYRASAPGWFPRLSSRATEGVRKHR